MERRVGSGLDAPMVTVDRFVSADLCILEAVGLLLCRLPRVLLSASSDETLAGQRTVLGVQPGGQRLGAEGDAGDDSGTGSPTSNTRVYGRDRTSDQSSPTGLDRILRTIRTLGTVPFAQIRQLNASGLGDAEIQAL